MQGWIPELHATSEDSGAARSVESPPRSSGEAGGASRESVRQIFETESDEGLAILLIRFFNAHRGTFFSVPRIKAWGSRQEDFKALQKFTPQQIREEIFAMVAENTLTTALSRRGNTLYGISRRSSRTR